MKLEFGVTLVWCYNCDMWVSENTIPQYPDWFLCPNDRDHFIHEEQQFLISEIEIEMTPIDLRPMYHRFLDRRRKYFIDAICGKEIGCEILIKIYGADLLSLIS